MAGQPEEFIFINNEEEIQADGEPEATTRNTENSSKTLHIVYLEVCRSVWEYIFRSKKFSGAVNSILSQYEIVYELDADTVSLKGQIDDKLIQAKKLLEELIEACQLETCTFIMPPLEPDIHSRVVSFLKEPTMSDEITYHIYSPARRICLTGKKKQIEGCLGVLQEIYGVAGALPFVNSETVETKEEMSVSSEISNNAEDHIAGNTNCVESAETLIDDTNCKQDRLDDELYGTKKTDFVEVEDGALIVNEKIWMYIEKRYSENIMEIKKKAGLDVLIEILDCSKEIDRRIRMAFSSPDEGCIHSSMLEMKSVIDICQGAGVKTLRVPCLDVALHQRITKLLKSINRLPSYVSVDPELIAITGTKEEIEGCLEKLKTYGLQYEDPSVQCEEVKVVCPTGNKTVDVASEDFDLDDGPPHQYEHYRQLPVPVEEDLWFYIDNRCKQQLDDLKKGYNLQITPDRASTPGFVNITLASHSTDMLDCGQDAVITLILQLREQIVLGVMNTALLEDLPSGLQGMLQQQFHNMDSIVVVKGNKIVTIGPNHEAMKSQQIVSAFMQNIVADARSMGYDTSKFDQAMMLKEHISSDELITHTSGDFGNFNYQEEYSNEIVQKGHHLSASGQKPKVFNGDDHISPKQEDQLKKFKGRSLLESKTDKQFLVSDTSTSVGHAVAHKDTNENAKKSFSSVVSDNLPPHIVNSRTNDSHKLTTNHIHCVDVNVEEKLRTCSSCHCDSKSNLNRGHHSCGHFYCVSCINQHFGEWKCPVCDFGDSTNNQTVSQPENGTMLVTYDNSFRLPGCEENSRGTIIITYAFPSGIQSAGFPNPGHFYPSLTATAFFPLCREGSGVVDLLQRAFEKRLVFKISQRKDESNGKLVWNGIHHKVNIYGGFQQEGYPDPNYLEQICSELVAKGIREEE